MERSILMNIIRIEGGKKFQLNDRKVVLNRDITINTLDRGFLY